jgi:hypothetical protein
MLTKRPQNISKMLPSDWGDGYPNVEPKALSMPLDDGCRLHQYHGVQGLRPDPVKPHPKQPICGEKLKPTFMLPPQHGHLMPKGDELKFQVGAATKAEGEQRNEGGKNRNHAHDGMATSCRTLGFY